MDDRIDCWCDTCKAQVTLEEIRTGRHTQHRFSAVDRAAYQIVQEYLTRSESQDC
jgi:hypothetical protein